MHTMTDDRATGTAPPRHAAERENMALLAGLVLAMALAVALGLFGVWGLRQHTVAQDAQDQIARMAEGQDAAQSELDSAEATLEEVRTNAAAAAGRLGICANVVKVSELQRAVMRGEADVRQINRLLHRKGYDTYQDLWAACAPEHEGHEH
jgi:uncharacterized protein HemX